MKYKLANKSMVHSSNLRYFTGKRTEVCQNQILPRLSGKAKAKGIL